MLEIRQRTKQIDFSLMEATSYTAQCFSAPTLIRLHVWLWQWLPGHMVWDALRNGLAVGSTPPPHSVSVPAFWWSAIAWHHMTSWQYITRSCQSCHLHHQPWAQRPCDSFFILCWQTMDGWCAESHPLQEAARFPLPTQILISLSLETQELSTSLELLYKCLCWFFSSISHSGSRQFWPECHLHPYNMNISLCIVVSARIRNDGERPNLDRERGAGSGKALWRCTI